MGILDEAIREHLELKRQHGAADSELKQLEGEAFGPPERPGSADSVPDSLAEAPTEFLAQPEAAEGAAAEAAEAQPPRREPPSIADLQEAPPASGDEPAPADEEPVEEEHPAMEHEAITDLPEPEAPPEPDGPSTEERHAIAEQPTELFDVQEELAGDNPPSPTDEELIEEEIVEPRLAPTDPLAGLDEADGGEVSIEGPAPADDEADEDEDFWDERRLSDELDQALEAPPEPDPEPAEEPEPEADEKPPEQAEAEAPRHDEDVLEETPDFLEETPEDDELWFEQKPPKDFDFDD